MFYFPGIAVQNHHARLVATRERPLRDQLSRQIVVVVRKPGIHFDIIKGFAVARKILDDRTGCKNSLSISSSRCWKKFVRRVSDCRGHREFRWRTCTALPPIRPHCSRRFASAFVFAPSARTWPVRGPKRFLA